MTATVERAAPPDTTRRRVWRCARCGETLAVLIGRMIVYPGGDTANLPARITCPRCKRRNVKIE